MVESNHQHLDEAIARNAAAVLSLPSAGMLRHFKTRFLAAAENGFWLEAPANEAKLIHEVMQLKAPIGIAFKSGITKVIFTTTIENRQADFPVNSELRVEALLLALPKKINAVQRRANYRVPVTSASGLVARVWRIPEHFILRDRPSAALEMPVQVRDISISGIGLLCAPADGQPQRVIAGQRLRLWMQYADIEVLVEGCVQYTAPTPDKSLRIGVQFRKLEEDLEGRQTLSRLTHIVGQLHREEVRRMRLGLAS